MSNLSALIITAALFLIQCGPHSTQSGNHSQNPHPANAPTPGAILPDEQSMMAVNMPQESGRRSGNEKTETVSDGSPETACDFSAYKPVRISHFIPMAAIKRLKPKYPQEAATRGLQGQIQVKILVSSERIVEKACATNGDELLRKTAEGISLQWKFKPNFGFSANRRSTPANKRYVEDFLIYNFILDKKDAGVGITVTP